MYILDRHHKALGEHKCSRRRARCPRLQPSVPHRHQVCHVMSCHVMSFLCGGEGVEGGFRRAILCVLYCTVLYCTVLHCTVLYCTVLLVSEIYCNDEFLVHCQGRKA